MILKKEFKEITTMEEIETKEIRPFLQKIDTIGISVSVTTLFTSILVLFLTNYSMIFLIPLAICIICFAVYMSIRTPYAQLFKIAQHNDLVRHDELIRAKERERTANNLQNSNKIPNSQEIKNTIQRLNIK